MTYLDVDQVSKHYDKHTALDQVSLSVPEGHIFGLLGPNGAGKSSLLRIINRITRPDGGMVTIQGNELQETDLKRIGYLPEERGLYPKMKVGEQLVYLARLRGLDKRTAQERAKGWLEKFNIGGWWTKRTDELSKGMQQKVQFIATVLHDPEFFIFDEPFSGFDPVNAELIKQEILALKAQGKTFILSTHDMSSVEELCDDLALIDRAHVVLSGSTESIRRAHRLGTILLGYEGTLPDGLLDRLSPLEHRISEFGGEMRLTLAPSEDLRSFIASLPDTLLIDRIEREYPSMHDIFLQTVQRSEF